jgi:hypothetical protein
VGERVRLLSLCRDVLFWDLHGGCSIKTMARRDRLAGSLQVSGGEACGWMDEDWLGCFCVLRPLLFAAHVLSHGLCQAGNSVNFCGLGLAANLEILTAVKFPVFRNRIARHDTEMGAEKYNCPGCRETDPLGKFSFLDLALWPNQHSTISPVTPTTTSPSVCPLSCGCSPSACRTLAKAKQLCGDLKNATPKSVDVTSAKELDESVSAHDLIISLIPYTFHVAVIKSAIKFKRNVVTTSYVSDAMKALEPE